jgi:hypothetical protein
MLMQCGDSKWKKAISGTNIWYHKDHLEADCCRYLHSLRLRTSARWRWALLTDRWLWCARHQAKACVRIGRPRHSIRS